ncbi:LOW QUALITY PROTEIN: uncharacterized protein LOC27208414 [Drosophila simulans]|uniref:Uncharacterized protein n=1 Tax=Drosophila simulans TaxID=7240 RepID=A0A0J9R206_DROSI|nr:LOW QUALITY PROTEIN: uncharacterized protein LOC27208414 [Drosophila simulans]KMY90113.1 LOW QUALITY PROTEIN: uncharacterized protein Dsimw501_GD28567 [Drosophila simulans]
MALVAHRMMLPARHRRNTTQQVARNKVGVLLVPSVADYYGAEMAPGVATPLPTPAASQLHLPQDAAEASGDGSGSKVSATSRCNDTHSIGCAWEWKEFPPGISTKITASFSCFSISYGLCFRLFFFGSDWRQLYLVKCVLCDFGA